MRVFYVVILYFMVFFCATAILQAQAPTVTTLSPSTNAINVARNSDIDTSFSINVSSPTVTGANIRVYGSQTGLLNTTGIFSLSNPTATYKPAQDFKPGELISVSVTTGVLSATGIALSTSVVYSFTVAAAALGGSLVRDGSDVAVGNVPQAIALGDSDGDGALDALVINQLDDDVSCPKIQARLTI